MSLLDVHPAPLRAWVRGEEGAADAGTVGLDAFGRHVLGVSEGDEVVLRLVGQSRLPGGMAHPPSEIVSESEHAPRLHLRWSGRRIAL